ncbi:hypothetical protein CC78DRAFT_622335 [Lojkania enalia]|uniref:Structure-specific endonuclease subunit SLX4 n=1 Tax=Lojkania enalia TaxID=147567 RepID=A0A9P4JZD4_9PLEO|nr:hypothetical protein CC78DRAFT_622335 [Didymosphaeria enalia]
MATFDLVLLSSSPPGSVIAAAPSTSPPASQRAKMAACSPISLSPIGDGIKRSNDALKSGSRAAPVPEGATRGFATANSLIQSNHFILEPEEADKELKKPEKPPKKGPAAGTPSRPRSRKPRAPKVKFSKEKIGPKCTSDAATSTLSHFPNPTPKGRSNHCNGTGSAKVKDISVKPRKPRANKEKLVDEEAGPRRKKPRATRKQEVCKSRDKAQGNATGTVSSHFTNGGAIQEEQKGENKEAPVELFDERIEDTSIWEVPASPRQKKPSPPNSKPPDLRGQSLELDEALARRRDWTPPRETIAQEVCTASPFKDSAIQGTFTHMLSNFAYAHEDQTSTVSRAANTEDCAALKRQRVELVAVSRNRKISRSSSPTKVVAPKKKARTITDLVTGQYAPKDAVVAPSVVASEFFSPQTVMKVPLKDISSSTTSNATLGASRKRSNSKSSTKKTPKLKKVSANIAVKPKMVAEKLLSPASAALRLSRQDILFGTSSQLALEGSPTMIREMQRAVRASEEEAEALPSATLFSDNASSHPWQRLGKVKGKRDLWAVSARDEDGHLLNKQDDVYIPEPDRTQDLPVPLPMDGACDMLETSFADIANFQPPPVTISSDLPTPPNTVSEEVPKDQLSPAMKAESFEDIDGYLNDGPPQSTQQTKHSFLDIDDFSPSPDPPLEQSLATTTSTCSPRKRRGRPLKSQRPIPPRLQSNASVLGPTTPTKQGRFTDIEEIQDSEDDEALSPTPPRILHSPPALTLVSPEFVPPLPTEDPVEIFRVATSQLPWAEIKDQIFRRITQAVQNLPPTANPAQPSWHEKILMYDPIILEDFTGYLNSQTAIRTWKRATQKQIKAWNKVLKANDKEIMQVEDDENEALVVEKELEIWMVQGWCQDMSICCILRKNRGCGMAGRGLY